MFENLKKFIRNRHGDVSMVLTAVTMAIVLAISLIIIYSVLGGLDITTIDAGLTGTPALNATETLQDNLITFYTLAPIAIIVVAAVAIIGYIMLIKRK